MTTSDPALGAGPGRAFLVERYISPIAAEGLGAATARVIQRCCDTQSTAAHVHYLSSAYLPSEDTCFCLFRADSSADVRAVNDMAGFPLDRITEATLLVSVTHQPAAMLTPGQTA